MDRNKLEIFAWTLLINSAIAIAVFYVMDQYIWKSNARSLSGTFTRAFIVALVLTLFQLRKKKKPEQ
jgi:F0F1-type ATP synthase membrane subunit a